MLISSVSLSSSQELPSESKDWATAAPSSSNHKCPMKSMKSVYPADQQVKFLHLQAEVESLLHQLQILKQNRQESTFLDQ